MNPLAVCLEKKKKDANDVALESTQLNSFRAKNFYVNVTDLFDQRRAGPLQTGIALL